MFERSARALQQNVQRAGPAAGASYTLIGAIILLGGIGYGLDVWLGTSRPWFLVRHDQPTSHRSRYDGAGDWRCSPVRGD